MHINDNPEMKQTQKRFSTSNLTLDVTQGKQNKG